MGFEPRTFGLNNQNSSSHCTFTSAHAAGYCRQPTTEKATKETEPPSVLGGARAYHHY